MKPDKEHKEPLAIVGLACRFPKAEDSRQYWGNILSGTDCIEEIPESHWSPEDYFDENPKKADMTYAKRGGFLGKTPFHPLEYGIPPKALEAIDTSQLLGMVVAREALEDAGYGKSGKAFDRTRTSVIMGVTGTLELVIPLGARLGHPIWRRALLEAGLDAEQTEKIVARIADGYVPWQEQSFPGLLGNVVAGRIANFLDLGGTNCVADAACASALSAVHMAALELWSGQADMVLTGGIDTFNDIFMYMCFSKTPALSPSGNAKPFSESADGTILGEGVGVVALKRLSDAEKDGDRIYAVLRGMGTSSDGKGNAIYAPSAKGQMSALRRAYSNADVEPATVELVEGHGTGTKVGDAIELEALGQIYREAGVPAAHTAMGSVKSQIGHTKAAAGVAGLIKIALSLHNKVQPPSIKVDKPLDPLLAQDSPLYLNATSRPWMPRGSHKRRGAVSAFGFGGSNFHAVLEEHNTDKSLINWDGHVQILAFSAQTRSELATRLKQIPTPFNQLAVFAAHTRLDFKPDAACRLLIVVEKDKTDVARILANALTLLEKYADRAAWNAPEGIFFGSGKKQGKLGILFPGQGSQYVGMLRDLACRFPQVQKVLEDVDTAFADGEQAAGQRLTDLIYPPNAFGADSEHETVLRETQNAQPAIGAVSIGALKLLNYFGVVPEAAAGHSYGEVTALCASDRFDTSALYMLSRLRGKLMAEGEGDRGAMLAVRAGADQVEAVVAESGLDLVLANKNAPDQIVLSGLTREVERAVGIMEEKRMRVKRLPVAAAFHTTLVGQASEPFRAELNNIDFPKTDIPVYSNTTAEPYPVNSAEARELLATQLTKPVEFVKEIRNMVKDGVSTFLEVGPGARLTGLVKSILANGEGEAFAVDASSGKRNGAFDLAKTLANLAALGHRADLALWEDSQTVVDTADRPRKGMAIELTGANYLDPVTRDRAERKLEKVVKPAAPVVSSPPVSVTPARPAPTPRVAAPVLTMPANGNPSEALRITQQNMLALQKIQEQTANLHLQFLQGQDLAQNNLRELMDQQRALMMGTPLSAPAPAASIPVAQPPRVAPVPAPFVEVEAPQPVPTATSAPLPPAPPAVGQDLEAILRRVVSEKTGYPEEMLEAEMSLDADLGIDSIKRVEILSAIQEELPDTGAIPSEQMGALQTLGDITTYLAGRQPAQVSAETVPASGDDLQEALKSIVAEKTGYPTDMLDLAMSLDGDLGIDSIKRVEILSALQEEMPHLPVVEPERMGRLETLGDIVTYLAESTPTAPALPVGAATAGIQARLMTIVAEKTGYPEDMLEPGMNLDGDLGIDSIKRVEILSALQEDLPELPAVEPGEMGRLETLGDIVTYLAGSAAPALAPAQPVADQQVQVRLLQIVAEKTGYPEDMLEPSMSLDSDLGIDSIKRVEILSSLQEALPELPAVEPDQMGRLETLGDIVSYLTQVEASPLVEEPKLPVAEVLLEVVGEKTGYPVEMLEMEMGLEEDLGIDSIKRVEILSALADRLPGLPEVSPDRMNDIRSLGEIVAFFSNTPTQVDAVTPAPVATVPVQPEGGIVRSVLRTTPYNGAGQAIPHIPEPLWVTDDNSAWALAVIERLRARGYDARGIQAEKILEIESQPEKLAGLVLLAPASGDTDLFLKNALFLVQCAGPALREAGAILATVSRLDGAFGLNNYPTDCDPVNGGLAGLLKTASHEWPSVSCRAFDVAQTDPVDQAAAALVDELLRQGPLEMGLSDTQRVGLILIEEAVEDAELPIEAGDLVVVSGGARGVTAEAALSLASAAQPTLLLLGRSALPEQDEPAWLAAQHDEASIKRAIIANAEEKMTPRQVNDTCHRLLAEREIRNNMRRMSEAGARVVYKSVDLRNGEALNALMAEATAAYGPVHGLIHGAGVLADRLIEDKTPEQFDRVYGTKVHGLRALLTSLADSEPRFMAFFSSSTGRFGRSGQVDYAMANEVLNKMAAQQAALRPACRVVSVNWGPWDGGMVTPALKNVFAAEGIGLIPLRAGADYLAQELANPTGPPEVVILGETEKSVTPEQPKQNFAINDELALAFELDLTVTNFPILKDHVMNDRAVLPMALMVEWLAHAALHVNPGFRFGGVEQLRVLKGITLDSDETPKIQLHAGPFQVRDGLFAVQVELRGEGARLHARAVVLLTDMPLDAVAPSLKQPTQSWPHDQGTRYQNLFHGPALQGLERVDAVSKTAIAATIAPAPGPNQWIADPMRSTWLADPMALDCAFQLMILWCLENKGTASLPTFAANYRQYAAFPENGCRVVASITESNRASVRADLEFLDRESGKLIARMDGYECVMDASLADAFARNRLPAKVN